MSVELIAPLLAKLVEIIRAVAPAEDVEVFRGVGIGARDTTQVNFPNAMVIPNKTSFPDRGEGNGSLGQVHFIGVQLGLTGTDPESLTTRCVATVRAVHLAIQDATVWPSYVNRVFIASHDYGVMFTGPGGLAYWPQLQLEIEVEELIGG